MEARVGKTDSRKVFQQVNAKKTGQKSEQKKFDSMREILFGPTTPMSIRSGFT